MSNCTLKIQLVKNYIKKYKCPHIQIAVLQDELNQMKEMTENVQFQLYFKMKSENKHLMQENTILCDMLRACQITGSTKEMELQRLKHKMNRYDSHSLIVIEKRSQNSVSIDIHLNIEIKPNRL